MSKDWPSQLLRTPSGTATIDPCLGPYTHAGQVIRAAIELASDVAGLRLALGTAVGDRYQVRVTDDGEVVGLWRG